MPNHTQIDAATFYNEVLRPLIPELPEHAIEMRMNIHFDFRKGSRVYAEITSAVLDFSGNLQEFNGDILKRTAHYNLVQIPDPKALIEGTPCPSSLRHAGTNDVL